MSGILLVAEHLRGTLNPISQELAGVAAQLKEAIGGPVCVAIIADEPELLADGMALDGIDEICLVRAPLSQFDGPAYAHAVQVLAEELQPRVILIGHTVNGMGYGPAVAARLGSGFASDVIEASASPAGIEAIRAGYANKVMTHLSFAGSSVVTLMIRGGGYKAPAPAQAVDRRAITVDFSPVAYLMSEHIGFTDPPQADVDINKANFILSVGRGIQDEKNIERFRKLADQLGATLGCSRPVADAGWLPKPHQVGLSGKTAANCSVYLALGISGAVQHLHGMKHIETIIAVNTDRSAPIYNVATHGVCMDLFEFADALEKQFS